MSHFVNSLAQKSVLTSGTMKCDQAGEEFDLKLVWGWYNFCWKWENSGIGGSNTDPINLMHWTIWKIRKT